LSPSMARRLSQALIDNGLDITWECYLRFESAFTDPELAALMHRSGCRSVIFGLESANQRTLNGMNKGTKAEIAQEIIDVFKANRISMLIYTIIGFPTETREEALETMAFAAKNHEPGKAIFGHHFFYLPKHSLLFQQLEEHGIVLPETAAKTTPIMIHDLETTIGMSRREAADLYAQAIGQIEHKTIEESLRDCKDRKEEIIRDSELWLNPFLVSITSNYSYVELKDNPEGKDEFAPLDQPRILLFHPELGPPSTESLEELSLAEWSFIERLQTPKTFERALAEWRDQAGTSTSVSEEDLALLLQELIEKEFISFRFERATHSNWG